MERITLENFRLFQKPTTFEIAPITILTGKNNSGKSTLIKAILLMSDYTLSDNHIALNFSGNNSQLHNINKFGNAISWDSKIKTFKINQQVQDYRFQFDFSGEKEDIFSWLSLFSINIVDKDYCLNLKRLSQYRFKIDLDIELIYSFLKPKEEIAKGQEVLLKLLDESKIQLKQIQNEKKNLANTYNKLMDEAPVDIGIIRQAVRVRRNTDNSFSIKFEANQHQLKKNDADEQDVRNRIQMLMDNIQVINKKHLNIGKISLELDISKESFRYITIPFILRQGLIQWRQAQIDEVLSKGKIMSIEVAEKGLPLVEDIVSFITQLNNHLATYISYLGPNRSKPSRLFLPNSKRSEIEEIAFEYSKANPDKETKARKFLKTWLKKFEIGNDLIVQDVEGVACRIKIIKNNHEIDLVDMGFGAGQLLSILLSVAILIHRKDDIRYQERIYSSLNFILIIEEPEGNLHPKLQSLLAEFFFNTYLEYKIRFLIETHSEYLLRKSQTIVKNNPDTKYFGVYYFDNSEPYALNYRNDGTFDRSFGPGFFDVASDLTLDLL